MIQLSITLTEEQGTLATLVIRPLISDRIKMAKENDFELQERMEKANRGDAPGFHFTDDNLLRTGDARTVILNDAELRREILMKLTNHDIRFIPEALRCTKIWRRNSGGMVWSEMLLNTWPNVMFVSK
jgi:hypothetical protein